MFPSIARASLFLSHLWMVSNAIACPEISKEGDLAVLQFDGGSSIVQVLRLADGSTRATYQNLPKKSEYETHYIGVLATSDLGVTFEYDKDIRNVTLWPAVTLNFNVTAITTQRNHGTLEVKSMGQEKFSIGDCSYDVIQIQKTYVWNYSDGVFVQRSLFSPTLGFFVRITRLSGNVGKSNLVQNSVTQVTGFASGFTSLKTPPPPPLPPVTRQALGMTVANSTSALRDEYHVKPLVAKGLIVTAVEPNSQAAEKKIAPGELIVEVAQEKMDDVDQFTATLQKLKQAGRKFALVLVGTPNGDARFVSLSLDKL